MEAGERENAVSIRHQEMSKERPWPIPELLVKDSERKAEEPGFARPE
jgi:hypothetical protein